MNDILKIQKLKETIVKDINESGLPFCISEMILTEILSSVNQAKQLELNKALQEEKIKNTQK